MSEQTASEAEVRAIAVRAREAAADLGPRSRADKDAALLALATALIDATDTILAANERDLANGRQAGLGESMLDRLALTADRIEAMAQGLRDVAALPDPVGEVLRGYTQP
ncbi:MAG TPA: gamma-glutamyl-phosphate reductase, partial [Micromonosporaceae bacterium]